MNFSRLWRLFFWARGEQVLCITSTADLFTVGSRIGEKTITRVEPLSSRSRDGSSGFSGLYRIWGK